MAKLDNGDHIKLKCCLATKQPRETTYRVEDIIYKVCINAG